VVSMVREQTCCFTGHRELPVWGREELAAKLEATITGLIDRGIRFYGAGGARGFDYEKRKVMRSEVLDMA
jgi:hypothetical protein